MDQPRRGGDSGDDDEPEDGDVVAEPLSGGIVIKIYGESRAWLYSDSPATLEEHV